MSEHKFEIAIHVSVLMVIVVFFIVFVNQNYPYVGHDYSYFIPRLLDTYLHQKINGLIIQWYTPSWGGGLPAYPNPQHIQFSLPQILTFVLNPWAASTLSSILFMLTGYFAMYFFATRIMEWRWQAGLLGALFFTVNGFYIEHMVVGHLGYQVFPLLAIIPLALFSISPPVIIPAIIIAFVLTAVVHEAGFYLFVIFILSLAVSIPALYLHNPKIFKFMRLAKISLLASVLFLLFSGSKIHAVYSFMRFFPRYMFDDYPITFSQGLIGMFRQYLGVMGLVPIRLLTGRDVNGLFHYNNLIFQKEYGIWEFDVSVSPVLLVFLFLGMLLHFSARTGTSTKPNRNLGRWFAAGFFIFAIWLVIEFTLANGVIFPILQKLPVLSSLHVNVRFASALIYPLAILGAYCGEMIMSRYKALMRPFIYSMLMIFVLAPMFFYFSLSKDKWNSNFNIDRSMETYRLIRTGKTFPVEDVVRLTNDRDILEHSSNLSIYEPLFGYSLDAFLPEVTVGSVYDIQDGYFNMTNPASLVFPEENQILLYERVSASDLSRLEEFVSRRQPDWNRPLIQSLLDLIAGISTVLSILVLTLISTKGAINFLKKNTDDMDLVVIKGGDSR